MSRYQAYPAYKDSGVEWVGAIPKTWKVLPLFSLASTDVVKNEDGAESNVLSLSYGRIVPRDVEDNFGLLPESFNTYQLVEDGDVILRLTDLQNDKRSLRVGLATDKGIITSAYLKLTAKKQFHSRYLYRLLHSYDTTKVFYGMGGGLRQSMKFEEMRRLQMLCPSISEQEKIAAFLDHETAKIDALIEKQQRLIELLKEKRQAVISHAVTKGLNPNAPMKESGVEWLGEVPAHWRITQIKYVAELNPRKALIELKPSLECNFVPMEKLKTESLLLDEIRTVEEVISGYTCFCDEDILMAKVTPCFENRNIAIARGLKNSVGFGSTEIYVLRTVKHIFNSFLLYRLQENEFMRMATGAMTGAGGLKRVPTDFVNNFKFAIPPIPEQLEICSFIEKQKKRYDSLESLARSQVELLQERRTALISAAVSGKIDVRDWQAAA